MVLSRSWSKATSPRIAMQCNYSSPRTIPRKPLILKPVAGGVFRGRGANRAGIEPATFGFGNRRSTVELPEWLILPARRPGRKPRSARPVCERRKARRRGRAWRRESDGYLFGQTPQGTWPGARMQRSGRSQSAVVVFLGRPPRLPFSRAADFLASLGGPAWESLASAWAALFFGFMAGWLVSGGALP
jgi:hypothetical protein